jgi:biotin synthase-related radical SAM superfamily protein
MGLQITLTISEKLYERARQLAQRRQQDIVDVLNDVLDEGLSRVDTASLQIDSDIEREKAAFLKMHVMLRQQYAGQHVAIYNGELIDHDEDGIALSQRIYARFPDKFVWITPIQEKPLPEFRSHSFRWVTDD